MSEYLRVLEPQDCNIDGYGKCLTRACKFCAVDTAIQMDG